MVRLRSAGGLTSRTTSLSRPMVTASPAPGTLPSGQDLGSDHSDRLTDAGGAWAGVSIFMPAWASWAATWVPTPSRRAAGRSAERRNRRDFTRMALVLSHRGLRAPHFLIKLDY